MSNKSILACAVCLVVLAVCNACTNSGQPAQQSSPAPSAAVATATPFVALPQDTKILQTQTFKSPNQTSYTIQTVEDDREEALRSQPSGTRDVAPGLAAAASDSYVGTARKAAKLAIANAPLETFKDLSTLINSLAPENKMAHHVPPITTTATSNRVAEEKRNVKVKVFLYAASREDDNDFHLILGRAPGSTPAVYFTMELSGLPPNSSSSFTKLKAARTAFKNFFGTSLPGSNYDFYSPPIPVEIEGSLFFDVNHVTGSRPGPASLRPKMPVVWEVHPITRITFEPTP